MTTPAPDYSFRTDSYAWTVVGILCLASIVSQIDRQVINLLVEPIKADLGISDTQVSLLQGFAFAIFYAIMALPLGRIADGGNRKYVILGGVFFWTVAAIACGLARNFWQLFLGRMAVGVGEATLSPAGYSLLADYFPRDKLSRAISWFTGTGFLGSGIALIVGGALLQALGETHDVTLPVVGAVTDWQAAFMLAAAPGFLVCLLLFFVREPPRQDALRGQVAESARIVDVGRELGAKWKAYTPIYLGFSILAAGQFALGAWIPTFFIRTHDWAASTVGYTYGAAVALLGTAGVVAGGAIADHLARRGAKDANLRVPMISALIAIPLAILFPLMPDPVVAMALVAPLCFLGAMPFGAGTAAIPLIAPNRMRAQLTAIYLFVANLLGVGAGPYIVAFFTDVIFADQTMIGRSIMTAAPLLLGVGALVLSRGLKPFARELEGR